MYEEWNVMWKSSGIIKNIVLSMVYCFAKGFFTKQIEKMCLLLLWGPRGLDRRKCVLVEKLLCHVDVSSNSVVLNICFRKAGCCPDGPTQKWAQSISTPGLAAKVLLQNQRDLWEAADPAVKTKGICGGRPDRTVSPVIGGTLGARGKIWPCCPRQANQLNIFSLESCFFKVA